MKNISVTQYAELKGISRQAVLKQIKAGKLAAEKVGNTFVIKVEEAEGKK